MVPSGSPAMGRPQWRLQESEPRACGAQQEGLLGEGSFPVEPALRASRAAPTPRRCACPLTPSTGHPPTVAPSLRAPALRCVGVSPKHTEFWGLNTSLLSWRSWGWGDVKGSSFSKRNEPHKGTQAEWGEGALTTGGKELAAQPPTSSEPG